MNISTRVTATSIQDVIYAINEQRFFEATGLHPREVMGTAQGDEALEGYVRQNKLSPLAAKSQTSTLTFGAFDTADDEVESDVDQLNKPASIAFLTDEQIEAAYRYQERSYLAMDVRTALDDRDIKATDQDVANIVDAIIDNFDANLTHNDMVEHAVRSYFP